MPFSSHKSGYKGLKMADWHISEAISLIYRLKPKKDMKKAKNEVYIVNQPRKSIMSVVFIEKNEYPLPEKIHDRLYSLSELSDLFFVFHGEGNKGINEDKFCNLYSACGWIISGGNLPETFLKVGSYSNNIFKTHTGFLVFYSVFDIPDIDGISENITSVNSGGLVQPIFKERRLGTDEIYKIYNSPADIGSLLNKTDGLDKKYSIWTSDSNLIFLRPDMFNKLETLGEDYIKSFSWSDIRYFIASGTKRLLIGNTNANLGDLEIGQL